MLVLDQVQDDPVSRVRVKFPLPCTSGFLVPVTKSQVQVYAQLVRWIDLLDGDKTWLTRVLAVEIQLKIIYISY